jgi:hypothetical protein
MPFRWTTRSHTRKFLIEQCDLGPVVGVFRGIELCKGIAAIEKSICRVIAKCSVGFEPFFAEHLIQRALVWEPRIPFLVVENVIVLVSGQRGFDIDKNAFGATGISNLSDCTMRTFQLPAVSGFFHFLADRQIDLNAQIDTRVPHESVKRTERNSKSASASIAMIRRQRRFS